MKKTTNKNKATHTTRPRAAKLETTKAKTFATPMPERHEEIRAEQMEDSGDETATRSLAACVRFLTRGDEGNLRSLAERLVDEIFDAAEPDDEQAQALLFIIQRLAFDDDCDLAEALRKELFCRCPAGDRMVLKFADRAKARYLKAAA